MIDIKLIRESPELFKSNNKKKDRDPKIVDKVLEIDEKWRKLKYKADDLRKERNSISEQINQYKKQKKDTNALIKKAKEIPKKLVEIEQKEQKLQELLNEEIRKIPTLMEKNVPIGKNDKDNVVRKVVGNPTKLSFEPKNHVELAESLDLADFDASAEVAGKGFYYLKNDLAFLNRALINFAIDFMNKKGYSYIEPPLMMTKKVAAAAGDLKAFELALYKIEGEEEYLIPSAEHALLGMLSGKEIKEENLPLKFFGYSLCFRKEIGSHGINEKGLWRTHQFNKVEQFIFCKPEDSWKNYEELKKNSEEILQLLELPYRIVECCTGDLGDWKAKSEDLEVWRPTTKSYGEVMSLSNCWDSQARYLNIKGLNKKGERYVLHTLNNTALATSRIMVAILENNQQKDGSIKIPKALQSYMGGIKVISRKN